jgi:aminoglycoside 2''-phosphotransferase
MSDSQPSAILPAYSIDWGSTPIVEHSDWLGEGDFCRCYLVNSSYVFRFAKHEAASAAMRVELCLLPILGAHLPIALPQPLFAGHAIDGSHALLGYRLLPGQTLEPELLDHLPAASQSTLIAQIAAFARRLHALPLERIDHCQLRRLNPLSYLSQTMRQARPALQPLLPDPVLQYYDKLFKEYTHEPALHSYQPALLHGDLSPDHLLADLAQTRLTGVIDFGDACVGDPAWDLIYIYEDYGLPTLQTFLQHYAPERAPAIERKVRLYQQLNNVAYCLDMLSAGKPAAIREALATLEAQALGGA